MRQRIMAGDLAPGEPMPSEADLMKTFEVSRTTARLAVGVLRADGLVSTTHGRGTFVRKRNSRHRVTRDRHVHRDERGYFFDSSAKPWVATQTPEIRWEKATGEIAHLLQIETSSDVLVRDRAMGEPDGETLQLATSYLPGDLVRGTQMEQANTGPGGIYDRMEELGHKLHWYETISARMPYPEENRALRLDDGEPVLRIVRVALNQDDRPLEVNDTRMSAEFFEIGYHLHPSAD